MNKLFHFALIFCIVTASLDSQAGRRGHEAYALDMLLSVAMGMARSAGGLLGGHPEAGEKLNEAFLDAVRTHDLDLAGELLRAGANPNFTPNEAGNSPLYIAAADGDLEMVILLITYGADPNARNSDGRTPAAAAQHSAQAHHYAGRTPEEFAKVVAFLSNLTGEEVDTGVGGASGGGPAAAAPPPASPPPTPEPMGGGESAFVRTPPRKSGDGAALSFSSVTPNKGPLRRRAPSLAESEASRTSEADVAELEEPLAEPPLRVIAQGGSSASSARSRGFTSGSNSTQSDELSSVTPVVTPSPKAYTPRPPSAARIQRVLRKTLDESTPYEQARQIMSLVDTSERAMGLAQIVRDRAAGRDCRKALQAIQAASAAVHTTLQMASDWGTAHDDFMETFGHLLIATFNHMIQAIDPYLTEAAAGERASRLSSSSSSEVDGAAGGAGGDGRRSSSSNRARSRATSRAGSRAERLEAMRASADADRLAQAAADLAEAPPVPHIPTGPAGGPTAMDALTGAEPAAILEIEAGNPTNYILQNALGNVHAEMDALFDNPTAWIAANSAIIEGAFENRAASNHIGILFADVVFADGHRAIYVVAGNNADDGHTEQRTMAAVAAEITADAGIHGGHVTGMRAMYVLERPPCAKSDNGCALFLNAFAEAYEGILVENPEGVAVVWTKVAERPMSSTETKVDSKPRSRKDK